MGIIGSVSRRGQCQDRDMDRVEVMREAAMRLVSRNVDSILWGHNP